MRSDYCFPAPFFIGDRTLLIRPFFLDQYAVVTTIPTLIFVAIPVAFLCFVAYAAISYLQDRRPPEHA